MNSFGQNRTVAAGQDIFLSPAAYDAAEQAAMETIPNRIIQCCQPVTFGAVGYPTTIRSISGVRRFLDVMHEGRTTLTMDVLGALTDEEMSLLQTVATKVATMSEVLYGKWIVPRCALLRALVIVRQIDILFPERTQTVLEIGGGTDYVGALLAEMGVRHISTDIAQAFYIVQSHLLQATADNFVELATDPRFFFDMTDVPAGLAIHVPWWKFVTVDPLPKLAVHAITCNHALLEMHEVALRYNCRLAHSLLSGFGLRCFLFEGWGSPIRRPIWEASRAQANAGFCTGYNDGAIPVLLRTDSIEAASAYRLPNPGGDDGEAAFHPQNFVDPTSSLTQRIEAGRAEIRRQGKYGIEDYDAMIRSVAGSDELHTEDERFLSFCFKEC